MVRNRSTALQSCVSALGRFGRSQLREIVDPLLAQKPKPAIRYKFRIFSRLGASVKLFRNSGSRENPGPGKTRGAAGSSRSFVTKSVTPSHS